MITRYDKPIPEPVIVWLMAIVLALPSPSFGCCQCSHDELQIDCACCDSAEFAQRTTAIGCCDGEASNNCCAATHCRCPDNCACHRADISRVNVLQRLVADEDSSTDSGIQDGSSGRFREACKQLVVDTSPSVTTSALERCIGLSRFQL